MLAMEEILFELSGDSDRNEQGLPPGFRFHPTDEELITFYLASKVFNGSFCGVEIAEVDLNRCEPWELPDMARMGEREWYFFSLRDRKYPTGLRTNRATGAGYWKATGKDREVYSASSGALLGMKKTLVFYKGRAPRGEKTKWVMHEYRLDGDFSYRQTCKEEWVICRIFHKMAEKKNPLLQGQSYMLKNCPSPNTGGSLPPLLETSTATTTTTTTTTNRYQNPFLRIHQQESDLKSVISTPLQIDGSFEPSFSATSNSIATPTNKGVGSIINNNNDSSSTSIIFKSLISSHQDFTLKDVANTISKQCKTEASFLRQHCQLSPIADHANIPLWTENNNNNINHHHHLQQQQQSNTFQNPTLSFGMMMDCNGGVMGGSSASTSSAPLMDTIHEMSTSVALTSRAGFQQMLLDTPIKVAGQSWALDL